jgi:hypothetical protein
MFPPTVSLHEMDRRCAYVRPGSLFWPYVRFGQDVPFTINCKFVFGIHFCPQHFSFLGLSEIARDLPEIPDKV